SPPQPPPPPPPTLAQEATATHHLPVDGKDREFIVYQPAGVLSTALQPTVFMLHGTSGDGQKFYNISGWKEKCAVEKCLAVFPSSLAYCIDEGDGPKVTTKWNAGEVGTIVCPGQVLSDDVKFFREMVAFLKTNYRSDPARIYVSGFSNGGSMATNLWGDAPDLFAAVAASGGWSVDTATTPSVLVPYYFTIGSQDGHIAGKTGFAVPLPLDDTVFDVPAVRRMIVWPFTKLGLQDVHTTTTTAAGTLFVFSTPGPVEMRVGIVNGLQHEYANGTNHPLSYATLFWDFFKQYHK
ncbi:MAG: PHB depolymerase family esterase, partial [Gemmatimonadales bacterium]